MTSFLSWTMLVALTIIAILIVTNAENEIYENKGFKNTNGEKRPFFVGSRYGRSQGGDLTNMDGNGKTSNRIVARNDRFFLGSRYGKRSLKVTPLDESDQLMSCFYTGIANLYRCVDKSDVTISEDGGQN